MTPPVKKTTAKGVRPSTPSVYRANLVNKTIVEGISPSAPAIGWARLVYKVNVEGVKPSAPLVGQVHPVEKTIRGVRPSAPIADRVYPVNSSTDKGVNLFIPTTDRAHLTIMSMAKGVRPSTPMVGRVFSVNQVTTGAARAQRGQRRHRSGTKATAATLRGIAPVQRGKHRRQNGVMPMAGATRVAPTQRGKRCIRKGAKPAIAISHTSKTVIVGDICIKLDRGEPILPRDRHVLTIPTSNRFKLLRQVWEHGARKKKPVISAATQGPLQQPKS